MATMASQLAERSVAGLYDLSNPTTLNGRGAGDRACCASTCHWRAVLSPFGLVLRADQGERATCHALGHPVFRYQLTATSLSAVVCAVAGVLLANLTNSLRPRAGAWTLSGELVVIVIPGASAPCSVRSSAPSSFWHSRRTVAGSLVEMVMPDHKTDGCSPRTVHLHRSRWCSNAACLARCPTPSKHREEQR